MFSQCCSRSTSRSADVCPVGAVTIREVVVEPVRRRLRLRRRRRWRPPTMTRPAPQRSVRNTIATERPRRKPDPLRAPRTIGSSSSATSPATRRGRRREPPASRSTHASRSSSGSADELDPARHLDPRRASDGRSRRRCYSAGRSCSGRRDWDWSFASDGALALDRRRWTTRDSSATACPRCRPRCHHRRVAHDAGAGTSEREAAPAPSRRPVRDRPRGARDAAPVRLRRLGGSCPPPAPASASRLLPAGPPQPRVVARLGSLHLQLPVSQSRVTAIGYQGGSAGALALDPLGTQANQGS